MAAVSKAVNVVNVCSAGHRESRLRGIACRAWRGGADTRVRGGGV